LLERHTRRHFLTSAGQLGLATWSLAVTGATRPRDLTAAQDSALPAAGVLLRDVSYDDRTVFAANSFGSEPGWRTSPTIETEFPATHVGLHWRGAPQRMEVRTSVDGADWTSWQVVTLEGGPEDNPHHEWFGALVAADRAMALQYRSPAPGPVPERLTVTYLNSVDGPRTLVPWLPPDDPRAKGPDLRVEVITREAWGADESIRFDESGVESWPRGYVAPRMVAVHHTATRNFSPDPAADVRAIYAFHTITRGWGDIGYNALIDAQGRIYEGRRGRDLDPFGRFPREVLSFGVVGAHALGYNHGSASVSLLGDFQEIEPSPAAWQALEELLVFQHRRFQVDPRTTIDFARSGELWRYDLPALCGHRDCGMTECPGDYVYARLPALRQRVAERINGGAPGTRTIVAAPGPHHVWPGRLDYRWDGAAPFDRTFEGFMRDPVEDVVHYLAGYDARALSERTTTRETQASFVVSEPGHYTLHVRAAGQAFADRVTLIVGPHVVRDNADPDSIFQSGEWASGIANDYYGSDCLVAASGSDAEFAWRLAAPESGVYLVQACWASEPDRSSAAPFTIAADGSTLETVLVDQSRRAGAWVTLSTCELAAAQQVEVRLATPPDPDGSVVVADAVRLLLDQ
jgi:hypothetical protein